MNEQEKKQGGWAERITELLGLKASQVGMVKVLAVALAVGILFLSGGVFGVTDTGTSERPADATEVMAPAGPPQDDLHRLEEEIAYSLERTLGLVNGAGKVRVAVTLQKGPAVTPLQNTRTETTKTDESATDGSKRNTTTTSQDSTNVMTKDGTKDVPAVASRSRAEIAGVLIVADGARSATVKARLHKAAMTALGIAAHRINVVPAEGR